MGRVAITVSVSPLMTLTVLKRLLVMKTFDVAVSGHAAARILTAIPDNTNARLVSPYASAW